jgi:hypothetical protein
MLELLGDSECTQVILGVGRTFKDDFKVDL